MATEDVILREFGKYVADSNGLTPYLTNAVLYPCYRELDERRRFRCIPIDNRLHAIVAAESAESPEQQTQSLESQPALQC